MFTFYTAYSECGRKLHIHLVSYFDTVCINTKVKVDFLKLSLQEDFPWEVLQLYSYLLTYLYV